jgi:uncharacterized protein (TIGR03089 family)
MAPTPHEVLAGLLRSDAARPRVTFYDDTPGPTQGERVELSGRVLANWVSKAANALQEEWDLGPGSRVRLDLPPHWRALYWALAVWSVGATVVLDASGADLVVTADAGTADAADAPAVLVTLAALARSAAGPAGPGVMDEARELATFADQFVAWEEPAPTAAAVSADGEDTAYETVVPARDWPAQVRLHSAAPALRQVLADTLAAWALDGSVVISRGPEPSVGREGRLASEGVTLPL